MRYLPIIERELRVAAHQARTWWRRVLVLGLALAILTFIVVVSSSWTSVNRMGGELFAFLGGFGMVHALFAGPFCTADCLGRERREGTLGLLFLTNLRSYDVVLGKIGAASIHMILAVLAVLPLVSIPLLLGGVTYQQVLVVALSTFNLMFFSLSVGVCASAIFASGRAAIGATLAVLLLLTFGLPLAGELCDLRMHSTAAAFYYMVCPLFTMERTLSNLAHQDWKYWLNTGGIHGLAWLCLVYACVRTGRSWREELASTVPRVWFLRWPRLGKGTVRVITRARASWRRMLERNPMAWLEGRDVLQERSLLFVIVLCTLIWVAGALVDSSDWLDDDTVVLWGLLAHYVLCLWIAIQAPRRLADDKTTGALELLLCTPLSPRELVSGIMLVLRRRFGRTMLWLVSLDMLLMTGFFYTHSYRANYLQDDLVQIVLLAMIVFPVQGYAFGRVGIYQGLAQGNSIRATLMLIGKLGILPWVLFIVFIMLCEFGRRSFGFFPRLNDEVIFSAWALCHLVPCLVFLAHANWQLRRNFRLLAVYSGLQWWRSLLRLRRLN